MEIYILLLPLIAAVLTGVFSKKIPGKLAGTFNSALVTVSALISVMVFIKVVSHHGIYDVHLFQWLKLGKENIDWSLYIDSLTATMLVVVTTVSAVVHVYSIGYMHDDENLSRFMAYLSLFTFFMLMLVTSNNLLQLFFGWEGVGMCSYLLIGFWYKKESASKAAIKAFIVNRVGDIFFALGIFSIYLIFGTVNFETIFSHVHQFAELKISFLGANFLALNFICVLLFIGCMGKSAQIGLHTWLPDAMEGPTPVSALIHAATMVTAGVFLVVRCSPLFEYAPFARDMVTLIGALTCVFAATIALTQNDIKRIVAYSTCSQLGYMFFACGVSAYSAAMFHLGTHAFFKALLFLASGSVIHALSGEQDIRKMGGLWKKIPITYICMFIGTLALCGIWPFAGYFSKDAILEAAYAGGTEISEYAYGMGIFAATCTAFYSFRLLFLVFHGPANYNKSTAKHIHEAPMVMIIPLTLLAVGAVFSGVIGEKLHILGADLDFWNGAVAVLQENNVLERLHSLDLSVKITPTLAAVLGIVLAYFFYMKDRKLPEIVASKYNFIYEILYNKYYFDELYDLFVVDKIKYVSLYWNNIIEKKYIDGFGPNGFARLSDIVSGYVSRMQTGYIYHYFFVMLLGMVVLLTWYMFSFV